MRRREFITLIGGAAAAWPFAVRAQQSMPLIGVLHSSSQSIFAPYDGAFRAGLKEAGYVVGRNVGIEYRFGEGHYERLPALVADLISRKVNVVVAAGATEPAKAMKAATSTIPIVFVSGADPVSNGLVESLNRPGGNITGISLLASALNGKKLDLLRALLPQGLVFAALFNPNYPDAKAQSDDFQAAAAQLGVRSVILLADTDTAINDAFATAKQQHSNAIVLGIDPLFGAKREQLVALASRYSFPMMSYNREFVVAGGLISYGPIFADGYRQAGFYVGRILKGEKPADLPVVQPTKFELVINMKTAKALGLDVPLHLQQLADELIE